MTIKYDNKFPVLIDDIESDMMTFECTQSGLYSIDSTKNSKTKFSFVMKFKKGQRLGIQGACTIVRFA